MDYEKMDREAGDGLNSESNVNMIAQGIRNEISRKRYLPGMKVKEADICREFGVSRTPVREAFRLLQNEGILTYVPHCGVQVSQFGEKDLFDCLELRSSIEVLSARKAAENAAPEQIREARDINEQIRNYNPEDPSMTTMLDSRLHLCIARMGGNNYIVDALNRLYSSQVFGILLPFRGERVPYTYKEHTDILDAIEAHIPEVAAKYMEIHFYKSIESNHNKISIIRAEEEQGRKPRGKRKEKEETKVLS